jgi:hypothetical protein
MGNPVYLHVTLKIDANKRDIFYGVMAEAVPIIEELGWKFIGAWADGVGRMNDAIDEEVVHMMSKVPYGRR